MYHLPILFNQLHHRIVTVFAGAVYFMSCFILMMIVTPLANAEEASSQCPEFLNHNYRLLHSLDKINLCSLYKKKPVLIVNTASHCGFTPQFSELEKLHQKYKDQGLTIIGFASNDFKQEAKNEVKAANICFKKYGVTFTMIAPSLVRGDKANPTFTYLIEKAKAPSWNFNKYLVTKNSVEYFGSRVKPLNSKLEKTIIESLSIQL